MSNNFFSTHVSDNTPDIITILTKLGYEQLEDCGITNNLLIDRINKNFWFCNDNCMKLNKSIIEGHYKDHIQEITIKELQSWES